MKVLFIPARTGRCIRHTPEQNLKVKMNRCYNRAQLLPEEGQLCVLDAAVHEDINVILQRTDILSFVAINRLSVFTNAP